ncbi:50S ribosomal protein L6 [archaeon CG10_big_fil_rev_8_21_14_0_10_43_11]|nr:MAG: 50S ribosomal protein L6 [archaeon CG10_big_fil_rev_8_21_14_0_10_43_11]
MKDELSIPQGVDVQLENHILTAKKAGMTLSRPMRHPLLTITQVENVLVFETKKETRNHKKILKTFKSHAKNVIAGVQEPYTYTLKICSSHFPMDVSKQGNEIIVKNFLGERKPRKATVFEGVDVAIQGNIITVRSPDKEAAGQTAANIEQSTRLTLHDRRRFQDGIYITVKAGRVL